MTENKSEELRESKLEGAVNYLQFVDCTLDAATQSEELQDRLLQKQEDAYLGLPIDIYTKITPEMTNSTSTGATFGGAWCNRIITEQYGCHSTIPIDKQKK